MQHLGWFELPPDMAYYYRKNHPEYRMIPAFRTDCIQESSSQLMSFLYPREAAKIYLPVDHDEERENAIFKATHQDSKSTLYWHLDEKYIGATKDLHSMSIHAAPGKHTVTIVDQLGNSQSQVFEIIQ